MAETFNEEGGRNSSSSISDTAFLQHTKKAVLTTQHDREKKKVLTPQLASAVTFFIWHMEAPLHLRFGDESVSHTGAMTRAESPPVGDEDDCNSRRDPPFTNDSPSHGKGPNQGR